MTIKSKSNEKNIFGTDYNSKEEIRKVMEKFDCYFGGCDEKTLSLIMDEDSFISEKDNDLEFLNKKKQKEKMNHLKKIILILTRRLKKSTSWV